jgi:hypothetical protein
MKRIKLIALLAVFIAGNAMAQYQLTLPTLTADKEDTVVVPVTLTNSSPVTAMQFELNYPTTFEYAGVELTTRKADHTVSASVVAAGRVRVIIYSNSQTAFTGTSGAVVKISLKAGTDPIANAITLSNVVLSNELGASLTATTTAGSITVNGPKAEISSTAIDFGRIVNSATGNATVTIYNRGNQSFNVQSATSTDAHFTVGTTLPLTVPANSSKTLSVSFHNSTGDLDFVGDLNIVTTDSVVERSSFKVNMKGSSYSLNTLQIGTVSGKTGTEIRIPVTVSNQVALSAMQLDLVLPDSAMYVDSSLIRGTNVPATFQMTASQSGNKLKILFYSNDSSTVPKSNAEFCAFKIKMNNYNALYPVTASQVILANTVGKNVMSTSSNGSITLTAPRLSVVSSIAFGALNVGDSVYEKTFTVSNSGNEPLIITAFTFPTATFKLKKVTLPLTLAANQSLTLTMQLTDVEPGVKSGSMSVISNEKLTEFNVTLSASIIANFELAALNITAKAGNSTQVDFSLKNDLNVTAIQFDMALPDEIPLTTLSLLPTNRIADWNIDYNKLASGLFRILAYSPSKTAITGTDGIVFSLPFQLPGLMAQGSYNLILSNVIVANTKGENVVTKTTNGVITVTSASGLESPKTNVLIRYTANGINIQTDIKSLIQLFDINGRLVFNAESVSGNEFIPLENHFIGIIRVVSSGDVFTYKILK